MGLTKYQLGNLLNRNTETNADQCFGVSDVRGVLNTKQISNTKADIEGRDLSKFLVVRPGGFVFNHRVHDKLGLGYNTSTETYIFTNDYVAFYIKPEVENKILIADYLYMWFLREEFDRYMLFQTYGSATLFFNWDNMCELEIELPDIATQKKYVDVYNALLANQSSYESGLSDLRLVCDAYLEKLKTNHCCRRIEPYIEEVVNKNSDSIYGVEYIKGISINKEFIETKADTNDLSTKGYNIVDKNCFAFNPNTARMGDKFCIAYNNTDDVVLVSAIYPVFRVIDTEVLCPEYLMMFFMRGEFDRYVRFNSWGSARETFNMDDIKQVEIPIPDISIQRAIVGIFKCYLERKANTERLKRIIKQSCPVLIKGSIEEAERRD